MSLTVGFDVTWMNEPNTVGGVFQYSHRLINALVNHTDLQVVTLLNRNNQNIFKHLIENKNYRGILTETYPSLLDMIKSEKIDVMHTPLQRHFDYTFAIPMITSLHDLQHCYFPELFSMEEHNYRKIHYKKSAEFSERLIVSYAHVKKDIVKFYRIPPEKIDVCSFGIDEPRNLNQNRFAGLKDKYHITDRYLFYPANMWRHKNHMGLIKALKLVHEKYQIKIPLICTGQISDEFYPQLEKLVMQLDLTSDVNFVGYIEEEDMLLLMKNSALVVIPTLYEAGSFPLIEAMAYEVPVICSNVTSLPETIGDSRFTFDPKNEAQLAEMIVIMLKDDHLRQENLDNSRRMIKANKWENTVNAFVETYKRAVESFKIKKQLPDYHNWILNFEKLIKNKFTKEKEDLETERMKLVNSLSWKITSPGRKVIRFIKKLH